MVPTLVCAQEAGAPNVRFTPESGHVRCTRRCPLSANSGHSTCFANRYTSRVWTSRLRHSRHAVGPVASVENEVGDCAENGQKVRPA